MADLRNIRRGGEPEQRDAVHGLTTSDIAALIAVHQRQSLALEPGERYAFPDLRDPRYFQVFVQRGPDGRPRAALIFHATVEAFVIADQPAALRQVLRALPRIAAALRRGGADEVHAFVPRSLLLRMEPWLRRFGLRRSNAAFVPFYAEVPHG